ncbi:GAF domain-containing protein [Enteractinococcus coprophilus]|uniref:GAF domain-containing protein n=1 Tax=Enteractinococcus coprophilus TaxID=1027633 RepID=A0A543AMW8_9MICC|nr:GAF domain-containing protein [Enteractinococcus coprophilus]TQL73908.1 GAF domain-containing protein [Enteractinococcus coprophilus]
MTVLARAHHNPADDAYQAVVAAAHQKLHDAVVDTRFVRSAVSESWRRCLKLHHTPERVTAPTTISTDILDNHRKTHPVTEVLPLVETLLAPAHEVGLITAISNTDGHLLWVDGAHPMRAQAETIGFAPGADWSEESMGTSAPGAALSTGAPVQVAGAEHFSHAVHGFYCSAVPLRHPSGNIVGMLDLTGSEAAVTPLALAMLSNTAQVIEQYWASQTFPDAHHSAPVALPNTPLIEVATGRTPRVGQLRLSNRHAEILTILDWHRSGLSATQLAHELFGDLTPDELPARLTTVRAEMSRLRKLLLTRKLPISIDSQPYRLQTAVATDAHAAMRALHRGDLTTALQVAPADILPGSDAPGIVDIRQHFAVTLREAVLADATPDQLWSYLGRHQAANDVEAWMLALKILPSHSPRRAIVTATLQRLTN